MLTKSASLLLKLYPQGVNMQLNKWLIVLAASVLIQACSSQDKYHQTQQLAKFTESSRHEALYLDTEFGYQITDASNLDTEFELSEEMKHYLATEVLPLDSLAQRASKLVNDLFDRNALHITYNADANYTPAEVFSRKQANCISLSLLTDSLAKAAGLKSHFRDVSIAENWRVQESLTTLNYHVNVELKGSQLENKKFEIISGFTVDFFPNWRQEALSTKRLSKQEMLARFYNNKGAEALANKDLNQAYFYFRSALELSPQLDFTWGNLAAVYRKRGFLTKAEKVYLHALSIQADSLNIKHGLAILYEHMGKQQKSAQLYSEINKARKTNPFYFSMLAEEALQRGEAKKAITLFNQALAKRPQEPSFYLGLAHASLNLEQLDKVKYYLQKGREAQAKLNQTDTFSSKLSALRRYSNSLN